MNYINEEKFLSIDEFFEKVKPYKEELKRKGMPDEKIAEQLGLFLFAQFQSNAYIHEQENNAKLYPKYECDDVVDAYPYVAAINERMSKSSDGVQIAKKVPVYSAVSLVNKAHTEIRAAGVSDNVEARIVAAVTNAIHAIYDVYLNTPQNRGMNSPERLIDVPNLLIGYPEILVMMSDEVTQNVFKNKIEKNTINTYAINKKSGLSGSIVLTSVYEEDNAYIADIESPFSTYDLAVMEAIITLYVHAESEGKLVNGQILLDIQSIDKLVKYNKETRLPKEIKVKLTESELYRSIMKLRGNHVTISDEAGNYDGALIDAEFVTRNESTGRGEVAKTCLCVNACPIIYEFAKNNGRHYYDEVELEKLKLPTRMTFITTAVYRYVMQRTREIFGTYFMDDRHMEVKKGAKNTILLESVLRAVYPDGLRGHKDESSAKRTVRDALIKICNYMKGMGYFKNVDYVEDSRGLLSRINITRK